MVESPFPRRRSARRWLLGSLCGVVAAGVVAFAGAAGTAGGGHDAAPRVQAAASVAPAAPASSAALDAALKHAFRSLPSTGSVASALAAQGVQVTVEGAPVPLGAIASKVVGFEQQAIRLAATGSGGQPSTAGVGTAAAAVAARPYGGVLQEAVAVASLDTLLWVHAQQTGGVVSMAAAQSDAQQQEVAFEHVPSYQADIPAGESLQTMFESPAALTGYQIELTIDAQKEQIAGPSTLNGLPRDRTPALASWMANQLAQGGSSTKGAGAPALSALPADLPSNL